MSAAPVICEAETADGGWYRCQTAAAVRVAVACGGEPSHVMTRALCGPCFAELQLKLAGAPGRCPECLSAGVQTLHGHRLLEGVAL